MSTRPKVLLTRRWTDAAQTQLAQRFELTINQDDRPMDAAALLQALRTHDAICTTVTDSVTAALLNEPGLRSKLIANFGVGFNHIDVQAARSAGIAVSNTPDVVTDATADLALLLMLMTARRAGEGERELRDGRWAGWRPTHLLGQDLRGKFSFECHTTAEPLAAACCRDTPGIRWRRRWQAQALTRCIDCIGQARPVGGARREQAIHFFPVHQSIFETVF
jgi:hypothetical protein